MVQPVVRLQGLDDECCPFFGGVESLEMERLGELYRGGDFSLQASRIWNLGCERRGRGMLGRGVLGEPAQSTVGRLRFKLALDVQNSHTSRTQERACGMAESFNKNIINFHSRFKNGHA